MSRHRREDPHGLTDAERDILQLVSEGLNLKEVAASRYVAHCTVRNQAFDLRQRLGAKTLAQAVAIALRKGLIT